ncbi:helix-turn-helix domain-containing protein [Leptospira terpstrae]|uniref:helix-turn-helix domain-containing protein n=1 Tax=Leptospira terpstrae TaxID=293075 RepID=UPI003D07F91C
MDLNTFIANQISNLREMSNGGRGMSQSELARLLDEKPNTISRWETGEYKPKPEDLQRLARVFNVSILTFFQEDHIDKTTELNALLRSNPNIDENDIEEIKKFAEFRIATKAILTTRLKSGRKRKKQSND